MRQRPCAKHYRRRQWLISTATGGGQRNSEAPGLAPQRSTRSSATALRFSMLKGLA